MHAVATRGSEPMADICRRLLTRQRPLCLDVQQCFPEDTERQRRLKHHVERQFASALGETVFGDSARLSIYGEIGGDDGRAQKRLMIQLADGNLKEITDFKDATVAGSERQRAFERYYFLNEADFNNAKSLFGKFKQDCLAFSP